MCNDNDDGDDDWCECIKLKILFLLQMCNFINIIVSWSKLIRNEEEEEKWSTNYLLFGIVFCLVNAHAKVKQIGNKSQQKNTNWHEYIYVWCYECVYQVK